MNRIKVLDESVKNKIAAGEVIEGPFSIVKELMENSLDAGGTRIEVVVEDAGMKKISAQDDGCGILKEDIPLAVVEHATSKITGADDIEHILSYGFRGEALSSMAAVSELTLLSRYKEEDEGAKLTTRNGNATLLAYAGPVGTTVIVENLFYTVPARKKFLKSKGSELKKIRETFLRTALPHLACDFTLKVDGRQALTLGTAETMKQRIAKVFALDMDQDMIHAAIQDIKVKIEGYFSRPHFMKSNRAMQLLYVNRRPVDYKYLGMILSRAYEGAAVKGEHPAAFIFIEIDPALVDVNIHPAKREVKIFDQRYMDGLIISLIRKGLGEPQRVSGKLFKGIASAHSVLEQKTPVSVQNEFVFSHDDRGQSPSPSRLSGTVIRESESLYRQRVRNPAFRILGVVFKTYAIAEVGEVLTIVDLHAAHERIIFDTLMKREEAGEVQELLFPKVLQLPMDDYLIVMEHRGSLGDMGIVVEDFADNSIVIRTVPEIARGMRVEDMIREFIGAIKEDRKHEPVYEVIAASVACHSAKRAGDDFHSAELVELLEQALEEGREMRCPHGRPYLYTLERKDLEKLFKRR